VNFYFLLCDAYDIRGQVQQLVDLVFCFVFVCMFYFLNAKSSEGGIDSVVVGYGIPFVRKACFLLKFLLI
jgi:hypothetical protein